MSYKIKRFNKLKLFGLAGGGSEEISDRDLIAYKIFVKTPSGYKSKIGEEAYKKNKLYEASEFNGPKDKLIGEGYFHSFPTLEDAFIYLDSNKIPGLTRYSKKEIDNLVIVKILIPKGSKYYTGNYGPYLGNYASKEMILKEEVKDNRDWRTVGIPGKNGEFTGLIGKQNIKTNKITKIPVKYHNRPLNPRGLNIPNPTSDHFGIKRFSWFDKLKELADKANKKLDPSYKTEKEREQEYYNQRRIERERNQENIEKKVSNLSRQHKIILEICNRVSKFMPTWGDGDEYPSLHINTHNEKDYNFGNICLGCQNEPEYHWDGKFWIDITDRNRKVYNLKQDILKFLKSERKRYEKIDYLDEDDIKEVLIYLDKLINEISKSNL